MVEAKLDSILCNHVVAGGTVTSSIVRYNILMIDVPKYEECDGLRYVSDTDNSFGISSVTVKHSTWKIRKTTLGTLYLTYIAFVTVTKHS